MPSLLDAAARIFGMIELQRIGGIAPARRHPHLDRQLDVDKAIAVPMAVIVTIDQEGGRQDVGKMMGAAALDMDAIGQKAIVHLILRNRLEPTTLSLSQFSTNLKQRRIT